MASEQCILVIEHDRTDAALDDVGIELDAAVVEEWPAAGSEDTELGVLMEPEVGHGEAEVYPRVQA